MPRKHSYILGINAYDHDVSACLLRDGEMQVEALTYDARHYDQLGAGRHDPGQLFAALNEGLGEKRPPAGPEQVENEVDRA